MIDATTKPNGSGRHWLEIGQFVEDEFGDKIWKPAPARYPHRDPALKVKRDYEGKGASQKIHWKIIVPAGYSKTIVKRYGDGNIEQIYPEAA
jgi:hypothetical protein